MQSEIRESGETRSELEILRGIEKEEEPTPEEFEKIKVFILNPTLFAIHQNFLELTNPGDPNRVNNTNDAIKEAIKMKIKSAKEEREKREQYRGAVWDKSTRNEPRY